MVLVVERSGSDRIGYNHAERSEASRAVSGPSIKKNQVGL